MQLKGGEFSEQKEYSVVSLPFGVILKTVPQPAARQFAFVFPPYSVVP